MSEQQFKVGDIVTPKTGWLDKGEAPGLRYKVLRVFNNGKGLDVQTVEPELLKHWNPALVPIGQVVSVSMEHVKCAC